MFTQVMRLYRRGAAATARARGRGARSVASGEYTPDLDYGLIHGTIKL